MGTVETVIAIPITNTAVVATVVECGVTNARGTGVRVKCSTSAWDGARPSELAGVINGGSRQ